MLGLDQDGRVEWAGRAFDSYHVWWSCGAPAGYGRTARPRAVCPSDPSPPPRLPQTWSNVPSLSSASPGSYPLSARWAPQTPTVITMSKARHKALLKNHNQSCFKVIPRAAHRKQANRYTSSWKGSIFFCFSKSTGNGSIKDKWKPLNTDLLWA